jgi:hypothetical protein
MNRLHLFSTIGLALALGYTAAHLLFMEEAEAYPSGAAVSYGSNPVFSVGGTLDFVAGADSPAVGSTGQDAIITDILMTPTVNNGNCVATTAVELADSSDSLAQFGVILSSLLNGGDIGEEIHLESGIRVPDGETLTLTSSGAIAHSSCPTNITIYYTLSGYYAEP